MIHNFTSEEMNGNAAHLFTVNPHAVQVLQIMLQ